MAEVATPLDSLNKEETAPAVEVVAKVDEGADNVDAAAVCHYFSLIFATENLYFFRIKYTLLILFGSITIFYTDRKKKLIYGLFS